MSDLYERLNVSRVADAKAIAVAFRKLVKLHHPDKCPGDPAAADRFMALQEAFDVLSDPLKRDHYDRTGQLPAKTLDGQREIAYTLIAQLLDAVVGERIALGVDPASDDLIRLVKRRLQSSLREGEEQLAKLEKVRTSLADTAQRFKLSGKPDELMGGILRAKISELDGPIEKTKENLATHRRAEILLKDRTFDVRRSSRSTYTFR